MIVSVHVHPRASRNEMVVVDGDMHAYVTAPPLEGKANRAVAQLLAKHFKVSISSVSLISGARSPIKKFAVANF